MNIGMSRCLAISFSSRQKGSSRVKLVRCPCSVAECLTIFPMSVGIGFAVPAELAVNVVNQLKEFGETRRGWLGVRIQPVTDDIAESLKMELPRGALVSGIIEGGPITKGEIKPGDIIIRFDGTDIAEIRDLMSVRSSANWRSSRCTARANTG